MRYYTYLNEKKIPTPNKKNYHPRLVTRMIDDNLYEILSNNNVFKLYLKNSNNLLYRGVKRDIYHYDLIKRRKDRKPKDMPKHLHDLFDYEFNKKFGWKARSEGVFITNNRKDTLVYGNPYIFIPQHPFRFLYSTEIKDLYSDVSGENSIFLDFLEVAILNDDDEMIDILSQDYNDKDIKTKQEIINNIMNTYKNNNIKLAIDYKHEIMFDCNEYYLFEESVFKQILKDFNQ